jgi:hypothetical protein
MPPLTRLAAARVAVCVLAGALAACSAAATDVEQIAVVDAAAAQPVPVAPPPVEEAAANRAGPLWSLPLPAPPLPAQTLAEIRDRPDLLADRRLPPTTVVATRDDDRFVSSIGPITPEIRDRMGESWSEGCPVGLEDLRYLTMSFRGFDGRAHVGDMVVHASAAEMVVEVFRRLFAEDFPIEEMRLVTTADHHALPTGDGNNTASYNCRSARGQKRWSAHAYGLSVDINPFQNPMVRRGLVTPELGWAYVDREHVRPGMLTEDGPAVRAFAEAGWHWGGHWVHSKDYMHFSFDGS